MVFGLLLIFDLGTAIIIDVDVWPPTVGCEVGFDEGDELGCVDGDELGCDDGDELGCDDGNCDGEELG